MRLGWLAIAVLQANACAQLYLIAGTPTPKWASTYAASLFRVAEDGSVESAAEIVAKEDGIEWLTINYELKKAVFLTRTSAPVVILDLEKASVTKECKLPFGSILEDNWLANVPGRGPVFGWSTLTRPTSETIEMHSYEMSLEADVDCDRSFFGPSPFRADIRFITAHGRTGIGDLMVSDGTYLGIDSHPKIVLAPQDREDLGAPPLPPEVRDLTKRGGGQLLRNQDMLVVSVGYGDASRTLLLRKGGQTWSTVPAPNNICLCREFGRFIAMTEARQKKAVTEQLKVHPDGINFDEHIANDEQSAGAAEWRHKETNYGPDQEDSFKNSRNLFPGRLHLYNIDTSRLDTIVTNQGDSEILLVENDLVYYRVADRLYSALITKNGIGAAKLVAKGDIIRDSHLAFIKH